MLSGFALATDGARQAVRAVARETVMLNRQVRASWILVGLFLVVLAVLSEAGGFHNQPTFRDIIRANVTTAQGCGALG